MPGSFDEMGVNSAFANFQKNLGLHFNNFHKDVGRQQHVLVDVALLVPDVSVVLNVRLVQMNLPPVPVQSWKAALKRGRTSNSRVWVKRVNTSSG